MALRMMSAIVPMTAEVPLEVDHSSDRSKLQEELLASAKSCHIRFGGRMELATESDQCVSGLCYAFESIFRHGLKAKGIEKLNLALRHVSDLVSGTPKTSPEAAFWPCIKEQLTWHEQERFSILRKVHSDFGRGRAWLRAALNERSLERHLHSIINSDTLSPFYEDWSFLLDQERSQVLPNVAAGLGTIVFAIRIDNEDLDDRSSSSSRRNGVSQSEPIISSSIISRPEASGRNKKRIPTHIISFDDELESEEDSGHDCTSMSAPPSCLNSPVPKDVVQEVKSSISSIDRGFSKVSSGNFWGIEAAGEVESIPAFGELPGEVFQGQNSSQSSSKIGESCKNQRDTELSPENFEVINSSGTGELPGEGFQPRNTSRNSLETGETSVNTQNPGNKIYSSSSPDNFKEINNSGEVSSSSSPGEIIQYQNTLQTPPNDLETSQKSRNTSKKKSSPANSSQINPGELFQCQKNPPEFQKTPRNSPPNFNGSIPEDFPSWPSNSPDQDRVLTPLTDVENLGSLLPVSPLDHTLNYLDPLDKSDLDPEPGIEATEPLENHLDPSDLDLESLRLRLLSMSETLEQSREDVMTSRLQLAKLQRQHQNYLELHEVQVQALNRENELLRQQLRKYVTAVQMLRRDSGNSVNEEVNDGLDYHYEAQQYQEKLVQVAEMHAELMEFNNRLTMQLGRRENLVKRLQAELECLRGPLSEGYSEGGGGGESGEGCLIHIWIPSAFLTGQGSDVHHVYQIYVRIRDIEWNIYRRYAQFYALYRELKKHDGIVTTFEFPPKKTIGNKDAKFVEDRRQKLQQWLRRVVGRLAQCSPAFIMHPSKQTLISLMSFFGDHPNGDSKESNSVRNNFSSSPQYMGL